MKLTELKEKKKISTHFDCLHPDISNVLSNMMMIGNANLHEMHERMTRVKIIIEINKRVSLSKEIARLSDCSLFSFLETHSHTSNISLHTYGLITSN